MKSFPFSQDMLEALGDKVLEAAVESLRSTRDDLDLYRRTHPEFVTGHSQRGLANWIHDRLWHHLATELDGQDRVRILDREPTREIFIDEKYRIRVKRHGREGAVTSYPTRAAIGFMHQPQLDIFNDLPDHHLIVGYEWDQNRFEIGRAVLSLRDGVDNIVWLVALEDERTKAVTPMVQPVQSPSRPVIDLGAQGGVTSGPEASGEHR